MIKQILYPVVDCRYCGGLHSDDIDLSICAADAQVSQISQGSKREAPRPKKLPWLHTDAGMYKDPTTDNIYKVYKAQQGDHMLCKLLVVEKFREKGEFKYQGAAGRFVQHEWKMSLEEAQKFGKIYGVCCQCGRTLTDETSIANGIGPICAGKFDL